MRPTSSEAMSSRTKKKQKAIPVVWVDGGVAFLMVKLSFLLVQKSLRLRPYILPMRPGLIAAYLGSKKATLLLLLGQGLFLKKGLWLRAVKGRTKLDTSLIVHTYSHKHKSTQI